MRGHDRYLAIIHLDKSIYLFFCDWKDSLRWAYCNTRPAGICMKLNKMWNGHGNNFIRIVLTAGKIRGKTMTFLWFMDF